MPPVLIFTHSITPRIRYMVSYLRAYFGFDFRLTSDENLYLSSKICRINYSYHRLDPLELYIHPSPLLSESFVREVKVSCFEHQSLSGKSYPAFFASEGDFGFDLFAAAFFLLTRYEEYLPHPKDEYGRFDYKASVAFRNNFLHLPLIDIWMADLKDHLCARDETFRESRRQFRFCATYDIDMAWSYLYKGWWRNLAGMGKQLITGKWKAAWSRWKVLRNEKSDPYDAYEWMDEIHSRFSLQPIYFFLMAASNGRYDKNILPKVPEFRSLVKKIALKYQAGIHPSWQSGDQSSRMAAEKEELEKITNKKIFASRQHYIRFELPGSFRQIESAGIRHEFSMGYGSINGFRASTATPYQWYDLKEDSPSSLQIYPFCFMDANAYYELGLSAEEAYSEMCSYLERVRQVDGCFIMIWHNSFLGSDPEFAGWREQYLRFLEQAKNSISGWSGSQGIRLQE